MFRELVRKKQEIPREECIEILKEQKRGVLSVIGDDGYPYGMPLNHYYDERDGKIYFHGGKAGHRLDALAADPRVSYCVMDEGHQEEGEWFLRFRSVIIFGKAEVVQDREKVYEISRLLSYKFTQDEEYIAHELQYSGPGTVLVCLTPEHMCGKRVKEN